MIIKIGDTITDDTGRTGTISKIGIGTTKSDPAGELGLNTNEYDLELNYLGSVIFGDNWCYFHQIRSVNKTDIKVLNENWIGF
tara:strand:+ start:1135 stop:1383 length:249 start_codon:yes stop_codon:yes gene_type:complete